MRRLGKYFQSTGIFLSEGTLTVNSILRYAYLLIYY
jgi:hypothetical protein